MEKWKRVVGYEGYYEVSDEGQVRSVDRVVANGRNKLKGRVLRPNWTGKKTTTRHLSVALSKDGKPKTLKVHRIVLEAWIGQCPVGCIGLHGPNGATDNSVENVYWGTHRQNTHDRKRDGTDNHKRVRRSDGVEFNSVDAAADSVNCHQSTVSKVCNGRHDSASGYGWEFI